MAPIGPKTQALLEHFASFYLIWREIQIEAVAITNVARTMAPGDELAFDAVVQQRANHYGQAIAEHGEAGGRIARTAVAAWQTGEEHVPVELVEREKSRLIQFLAELREGASPEALALVNRQSILRRALGVAPASN